MYFITGNASKFAESKAIFPDVEQLDIDLPEIQEIDAHVIIRAKLLAAFEHHSGPFVVEDTSLYLECMNGLPGPLIRWFLQTVGPAGLYKIASAYGNLGARAVTMLGYAEHADKIEFFEGVITGTIREPQGDSGFGWDPVFVPDGYDQSFAELGPEIKNRVSMRFKAFEALKGYLDTTRS